MRANARLRRSIPVMAAVAALGGCRTPTEAFVEIATDSPCKDVDSTGITAGLLGDIETARYGTTTQACDGDGSIGSIVLYPESGPKDGPFAFKVVTSLRAPVEDCVAPAYGPSCIVARRAMRFAPHEPFHVPVRMSVACAGVVCPEDQTCVDGVCHTAEVDPVDCQKPDGCDPTVSTPPAWQKSAGGTGTQMARHVAVGKDGTVAVTGNFADELDLGAGAMASAGGEDIFVASYSQGGQLRWAKSFGGKGDDEGSSVAVDGDGNVYLLASFMNGVDFGGGTVTSAGSADVALVKLTSFGHFEWAVPFGGPEGEMAGKLAVGADGNVAVAGSFTGSLSIGKQTIDAAGASDAFVASFSPSGDLRWAKALGGAAADSASAVAVGPGGDVFVTGQFAGQVDFGQGSTVTAAGQSDVFVVSLAASGGFRWAKTLGSKGQDTVLDIAASAGGVVVTGSIAGAATIDGTPVAAGTSDGFVLSLGADGKVAWAKSFGDPTGIDQGNGVAFADDGAIVLAGVLGAGSAFGSPPLVGAGVRNPFLAVLEADGKPRWAKSYPTANADASTPGYADVTGVAPTSHGFAYLAGWFTGKIAIDGKTVKSAGAEDVFLLRVAAP